MSAMDLTRAAQLAMQLMHEHGLLRSGWHLRFGHGKRQLGSASIRRKVDRGTGRVQEIRTITLSRYLVALNDEATVRDTILHEIAHALAGLDHGHDAHWQEICRRIGARPQRLADEQVQVAPARYEVVCDCCGRVLGQRHQRMAPLRLARMYCRNCGRSSLGKLRQRLNQALRAGHPDRMPA